MLQYANIIHISAEPYLACTGITAADEGLPGGL